MKKKNILIGALIPLAIILASCGGPQQTSSTTPPTSESTTSVAEDAIKAAIADYRQKQGK